MNETKCYDVKLIANDDQEKSAALAVALAMHCVEYVGENVHRLDQRITELESPSSFHEEDIEDTTFSGDSFNPDSEAETCMSETNSEFASQLSYADSSTIFDDIHEELSTAACSEPHEQITSEEQQSIPPRRSKRLHSPLQVKPSLSTESIKPVIKPRKINQKNRTGKSLCDGRTFFGDSSDTQSKSDYRTEARVKKVLDDQKNFMIQLATGTCTEHQIRDFIMRGLDFVGRKCCALTTNTFKIHASLKLILVNTLKVFDFQICRGSIEVALMLEKFMKTILTKFTKHSSQMNCRSRRWLFAYELLTTCLHVISHSAVLMGLEAFFLEFHLTFIKFNVLSKRRPSRVSIEYRSYVSEQLSSLVGLISYRLGQIAHKEKYNLIY